MSERSGSEDDGKRPIKVVDRRAFTADGERRDSAEAAEAQEQREEQAPAPSEAPPAAGFEHKPVEEPEGVDFTMLLNAMAQPALLFLGEIPHPDSQEPTIDLVQARLQIDMLDLLRVKCRGNLTQQEEGLLDRVLYQLRMLYVTRSGSANPQS